MQQQKQADNNAIDEPMTARGNVEDPVIMKDDPSISFVPDS